MQMQSRLTWKMDIHRVVLSLLFVALVSKILALGEAAEADVLIAGILQEAFRLPRLSFVKQCVSSRDLKLIKSGK